MSLLTNITVVVLADHLVDFGAMMLARLGADVVLVDAAETTAPRRAAWRHGLRTFQTQPLSSGAAPPADLADLIGAADVLLEDRRSGHCAGISEIIAEITAANPRLIHIVATGFPAEGPSGPQRPATDLTLMAQSGLMHVIGQAEAPPLRLPGEQAYALTGIQVATAALMGLRARRASGQGTRIEVSALQSAALANYREAVMYEWTGRIGRRVGNRLVRGRSGVRQVWPCADGHVTWSMIDNPGMMRALVRVMIEEGDAGELAEIDWGNILVADTDQALIERWQAIVGAFFTKHSRETLGAWSLEHGWGLSPITKLTEVPESPQMVARGIFGPSETGHPIPSGPLFAVHGFDEKGGEGAP